jgi:two-component system chemotaxis response regulator CheY
MEVKPMAWLVANDALLRRLMQELLGDLGYEFQDFHEPGMFMETLLDGEQPDLLFLDIQKPELAGLELLSFIRTHNDWDGLPVVMVTEESEDEWSEQSVRLGADGYLFKPVNLDDLEQTIQLALDRRRIRGEE